MKYFTYCLKHYADFSGRATRSEYWFFTLFYTIFYWVGTMVANILDVQVLAGARLTNQFAIPPYSILFVIGYLLAFTLPSLAVACRRLHDVGHSGWFVLIILIPIVGVIWLLVLLCTDSQPGENEYGENPKEENEGNVFDAVQRVQQFSSQQISSPQIQKNTYSAPASNQNADARIIRVMNDVVSVGMNDGSFFDVNTSELDFMPMVGDAVFVYVNGDSKIVTKTKLF